MTNKVPRRDFLIRSGVFVGGGALAALAGCKEDSPAAQRVAAAELSTWPAVRDQFELDPSFLHFAAPVLATHPRVVREAIEEHRINLDRNTKLYLYENETKFDEDVLAAAADYFGPSSGGIAMTDSTTMGLGILYAGIAVRPDQEVVTTDHDFYATHESLRLRAEKDGTKVRRVRLYDDLLTVTADEIVERIDAAIADNTRVLAMTWVHSSTGLKIPAQRIAEVVDEHNRNRDDEDRVLLCLDSVHAIGVEAESPGDIGCDFLVTGCHKWLFGPRGTGVIWAKGESWAAANPTIPTFDGQSYVAWLEGHPPVGLTPGAAMTPGGFHSFEHRWALAEALRLHLELGKERVTSYTRGLATRFKEGLAEIEAITVETPMNEELSAGIVCFMFGTHDPRGVVDQLENEFRILASVSPYREGYIRFMTSIVNTEDQIDEVLLALRSFG